MDTSYAARVRVFGKVDMNLTVLAVRKYKTNDSPDLHLDKKPQQPGLQTSPLPPSNGPLSKENSLIRVRQTRALGLGEQFCFRGMLKIPHYKTFRM